MCLEYPKRLDIELTNDCQLHCIMCPRGIGKMTRPVGYMEWNLLAEIVEESQGKTERVWAHVFGESLMHSEAIGMISLLTSHIPWVGLSTNAVNLTRTMSYDLMHANLDTLILSLDSMHRKKYEARRVGAKFDKVIRNIQDCIQARRDKPEAKTVILVQLINFRRSGIDARLARMKFGGTLRGIGEVSIKPYTTYGGTVPVYSHTVRPHAGDTCEMADYAMTILWNGDATICCHDVNGDYVFGNVNDTSITHLWNSGERREYHRKIKEKDFDGMPMCKNCIG